MVDANGDYSIEDAEHLRQLDQYNLMMIWQPLSYSDIYGLSILQRSLSTPLCLDESIHDLANARAGDRPRQLPDSQHRAGGAPDRRADQSQDSEKGHVADGAPALRG